MHSLKLKYPYLTTVGFIFIQHINMLNNLIKKIWIICLWIASLCLVWCFNIPDEDWIPSRNKVETWKLVDNEMQQAFDSLVQWFEMISSQQDEIEDEEVLEIENSEGEIFDEKNIDVELEDWVVEVIEENADEMVEESDIEVVSEDDVKNEITDFE